MAIGVWVPAGSTSSAWTASPATGWLSATEKLIGLPLSTLAAEAETVRWRVVRMKTVTETMASLAPEFESRSEPSEGLDNVTPKVRPRAVSLSVKRALAKEAVTSAGTPITLTPAVGEPSNVNGTSIEPPAGTVTCTDRFASPERLVFGEAAEIPELMLLDFEEAAELTLLAIAAPMGGVADVPGVGAACPATQAPTTKAMIIVTAASLALALMKLPPISERRPHTRAAVRRSSLYRPPATSGVGRPTYGGSRSNRSLHPCQGQGEPAFRLTV
jgi:hypothetical protein